MRLIAAIAALLARPVDARRSRLAEVPASPGPLVAASGDPLLHGFCAAGLPFLVGIRAFETLAHFADFCDDGRRLVARALLSHGLAFAAEEDYTAAVELLASSAEGLAKAGAATRSGVLADCVASLRVAEAMAPQPGVARVAAGAIVAVATTWGGAEAPATARLIEDLEKGVLADGRSESQGSMRVLAALAIGLPSGAAIDVLVRGTRAGREPSVRGFAATRLLQVVSELQQQPAFALRCVDALRRVVLEDENASVRFQAAYNLVICAKDLRQEDSKEPALLCATGLREFSERGRDAIDRQLAARGLSDIAQDRGGAEDALTEESITALSSLARRDEDSGVRIYAATLLEECAVSCPGSASSRCVASLEALAAKGREASDRMNGADRLVEAARAFAGSDRKDAAERCVAVVEELAREDPDAEVRAYASRALEGLCEEEGGCGEAPDGPRGEAPR